MDRQIGTSFFQSHFQLLHKQSLAAHLAQGAVQDLVALGGHPQQGDLVPVLLQKRLDMFGLPEGQAAFARGDGEMLHSRNLFVNKKQSRMLAWSP